MRLPYASSPRLILILTFSVPLLSVAVISALSSLSSSLIPDHLGGSLTSTNTISTNADTSATSPSTDGKEMITRPPITAPQAARSASSAAALTSRHYHIPSKHTATPLATISSTPFPGPRCTETYRRVMLLTTSQPQFRSLPRPCSDNGEETKVRTQFKKEEGIIPRDMNGIDGVGTVIDARAGTGTGERTGIGIRTDREGGEGNMRWTGSGDMYGAPGLGARAAI
jgi:hypothetical protein